MIHIVSDQMQVYSAYHTTVIRLIRDYHMVNHLNFGRYCQLESHDLHQIQELHVKEKVPLAVP